MRGLSTTLTLMMDQSKEDADERTQDLPIVGAWWTRAERLRREKKFLQDAGSTEEDISHVSKPQSIFKYARKMNLPIDVMQVAAELFADFAQLPGCPAKSRPLGIGRAAAAVKLAGIDVLEYGFMPKSRLPQVLCRLLGCEDAKLPNNMSRSCTHAYDEGGPDVDFEDFASFLSRHIFTAEVLVSPQEKVLRDLGRLHGLRATEVDYYKSCFDKYDSDGSGMLDREEFYMLLEQLLRIPKGQDLSMTRKRMFWSETDVDGSGSVNFSEFMVFYSKYFGESSDTSPLEEYYRRIRKVSVGASDLNK